jgi:Zn-dependent protease with chaperone function
VNEAAFAIVLALAWFGAVNAGLSTLVAAAAWLIERGVGPRVRPDRPAALLGLRIAPGLLSLLFIVGLFLPAHWRFEPTGAEESAGYSLIALAGLGAAGLLLAARRVVRDGLLTRRLERAWLGRAPGSGGVAGGLPLLVLPGPEPVVSLVGIRRPRLFVAARVIDACTPEELEVSLAHEVAHRDSRDNLKRVLVACSPDLLAIWPAGRRLEQRWRAAVEFAADARAARGDGVRAVSLASALLKVARLAPVAAPAAGFGLYDGTLLWARIDRLLGPVADAPGPAHLGRAWSLSLGAFATLAAVLTVEGAWLGVHAATEGLVRLLP